MTCYNNVMADNSNEDDVNEHCETTLNTTTDLVRCKSILLVLPTYFTICIIIEIKGRPNHLLVEGRSLSRH